MAEGAVLKWRDHCTGTPDYWCEREVSLIYFLQKAHRQVISCFHLNQITAWVREIKQGGEGETDREKLHL